jgi:zinc transporter ZupT
VAFLFLAPFLSPTLFGAFSAGAAGLMVYVSVHQILSMAHREEMPRPVVIGVFAGMALMGASMAMLGLTM